MRRFTAARNLFSADRLVLPGLIWTATIGASLTWSIHHEKKISLDAAAISAREQFSRDILYRRWAASHGGVYVPVTEVTLPNPYLSDVPERDITTPSGKKLTLINPAYMTRQVHELGWQTMGIPAHITSLNPIRPANAPDLWETEALKSFATGKTEAITIAPFGRENYLRLMRPLMTDESCLTCHARQGYKAGEIRGGISVAVPLTPYTHASHKHAHVMILCHTAVWLAGLFALWISSVRIRKHMAAREEAVQSAKKAADAKNRFLATMSHEIRTPMNAVIGMTDLLLETPQTPEQKEYTEIIRVSGEALLGVINDILDFSKIEAGGLTLENEDFDLIRCVEETLDLIAAKAAEKRLELLCETDSNVPALIRGDAARLRQVLLNLLSNAVKFTTEGEICLSITARPSGEGHEIEFAVRDTGIGIRADKLEMIFQEFVQADSSTTRQYGGSGLGLPISRKLCELMGGQMTVESSPGNGSVFRFTIFTPAARHTKTIGERSAAPGQPGGEVLVVDDNPTSLKILCTHLSHWGFTPEPVAGGREALAALAGGRRFILLITDMQMPEMDGRTLIAEIRKAHPALRLPAILLTSIGRERAAPEEGIGACICKPVRPAQLKEQIHAVLSHAGQNLPGAAEKAGKPLRILVAEDNPFNQKVILTMLEQMGHTADLAANGLTAVRMAEDKFYNLILMDIEMPLLDGMEATRQILANPHAATHPRIIGLSAHADADHRKKALEAGMADCLTKPVRKAEIEKQLEHAARVSVAVPAANKS